MTLYSWLCTRMFLLPDVDVYLMSAEQTCLPRPGRGKGGAAITVTIGSNKIGPVHYGLGPHSHSGQEINYFT